MKKKLTPRFIEPIAAALMSVGFFIFVSVLADGLFWRSLEERLWRRLQGAVTTAPQQAVLIKGSGREQLSPAQRRVILARDLELLAAAGARAILLEAWLDDSSQAESVELLTDLFDSTKSLPKKSAQSVQSKLASLKARLNADATLASAMRAAGNVILPVAVELSSAGISVTSTVWAKAHPYQVMVKGKGSRRLDGTWRLVRAPLETFREACLSLALIPPPLHVRPEMALEVPAIFQVRGHWVNGMGFESARIGLDLSAKGLQFIWHDGRLAAVEMRGARYPVTPRGGIWLGPQRDRAQLQEFEQPQLEGAPLLRSLKGRIVFYQPWPGLLVGEQAFARQRELAAGLLSRRVQSQPEGGLGIWVELGIWVIAAAGILFAPLALAFALVLSLASAVLWSFLQAQGSLAKPLAMIVAAVFSGAGLKMLLLLRQSDERRFWLKGNVAGGAHDHWEKLLGDPGAGSTVQGTYLALRPGAFVPALRWAAWAERHRAFYEPVDDGNFGFLIPLGPEKPFPLSAIQELRYLMPGIAVSACRGDVRLESEKILDQVRWGLSGSPKKEAQAMLRMAKAGQFVLNESDYAEIRQNVKIQLLGEIDPSTGSIPKKIFNIIEVF